MKRISGHLPKRVSALGLVLAMSASIGLAGATAPAFAQTGAKVAGTAAAAPQAQRPPNIVLILADDLGVEGINSYGGEYYTPNIDRLAREGMRFDNAHATPLCSPSRTRLMTGLENHRNYDAFGYLAPGQVTFGNVLKKAGYATGMVGKWQLSGNGFDGLKGITPEGAGFDESYLWQLQAQTAKGSRYWGPTRATNGKNRINEQGFGPDYDNDAALDFIQRHKDKPFFLYYSMVLVHNPFVPTPATMDAKGAKDRFSGMMSYMDRQVGTILDKLKALGLDDNTIVVFTGDNGTNQQITSLRNGYAVRGGKGDPTLNGTHVPMIVRAPGITAPGSVSQGLFDFTDMLPTFADLAGAPVAPKSVDGVSQVPVLAGKAQSARTSIFMHYAPVWQFDPSRFVFDVKWKLYGDGRFVALDPMSGKETTVDAAHLKGEAARKRAEFQRLLDTANDGPMNKAKFPWCTGQPSLKPGVPAIEAGCPNMADLANGD
ncbi:sulfatase-like hydrolase/transferase [Sphingobium sp. CAP-1]|uniref:sulfatase-like hydrolase/transferase n=1 Tax=Sphingobium sp. CAP-1 TaxID=2676077 RepID=UPI0018AD130C|nr:sulfatase-like hydrolase/transferase [Sphingobium sp. CAP-1]